MRKRASAASPVLMALALLVGCSREKAPSGRDLPRGDAIWFEEGVSAADTEVETLLARGGFSGAFLPAVRFGRGEGQRWTAEELPAPPHPFLRPPVFLVVQAGNGVDSALTSERAVPGMSDALWLGVKATLRHGTRFGGVHGIHLDFPFSASGLKGYRALVSDLRSKLPPAILLTVSLRSSFPEPEREEFQTLGSAADGLLALVYGEGNSADPVTTDALGMPWWAAYAPAARGFWTDAQGQERGLLPESLLARLTNDRRLEFTQDLMLKEESDSVFLLKPREPFSDGERKFQAGDRLSFRQPALSDMIYRLGADLTGRRHVRGRVILLTGPSESDRIFRLAALNDVLLGHSIVPDLRVSVEAGRGFLRITAENLSPHASVISPASNWVEVDIPSGGISDVSSGGFDRFEVFGPDGRPVTLGLATRVRFYETLIGPLEKIEPARITLRRPPPAGCCVTRIHVLAASGSEISGDGSGPAPPGVGRR